MFFDHPSISNLKRCSRYKRYGLFRLWQGVILAILSVDAGALSGKQGADLTAAEWYAWPDFCKAAFAAGDWRYHSRFSREISKEWVAATVEATYHTHQIRGAHHFCLGMVYVHRARVEVGRERAALITAALRELGYSYQRTESTATAFSNLVAYVGVAHYLAGNYEAAVKYWEQGIMEKPGDPESYLAYAEMLFKQNKAEEALELLLKFYSNKRARNGAVDFFIGHAYLKLGQYDQAREYAELASEQGYPVEGLTKKIDKAD